MTLIINLENTSRLKFPAVQSIETFKEESSSILQHKSPAAMTWYWHILSHLPSAKTGRGKDSMKFSQILYSRGGGPGRGGNNLGFSNDILSISGFEEYHCSKVLALRYTNTIRKPHGPWEPILFSFFIAPKALWGANWLFSGNLLLLNQNFLYTTVAPCSLVAIRTWKNVKPQLLFPRLMTLQDPGQFCLQQ